MSLGADFIDGQRLDPEAGQKLKRLILGDLPFADILDVVGIHELVKSAEAQGMSVRLDLQDQLDKPHRLHRFTERPRRFVRDFGADAADFGEFRFSRGVVLFLRHLFRERAVAKREGMDRVQHRQHGVIKHVFIDTVGIGKVESSFALLYTFLISFQPVRENFLIIHGQMRVARVQLAFHAEDARLHENIDFFRQQRFTSRAEVVILPERRDVPELLFGFLGDVKHVAVSFLEKIQLGHHEFHRVFREDRRVPVLGRLIAYEQRFVFDVNAHVLEDILEHPRSGHHPRLIEILFVAFGRENGAFGVNIRLLVQNFFAKFLHSCGQRPKMFCVFHICLPFEFHS